MTFVPSRLVLFMPSGSTVAVETCAVFVMIVPSSRSGAMFKTNWMVTEALSSSVPSVQTKVMGPSVLNAIQLKNWYHTKHSSAPNLPNLANNIQTLAQIYIDEGTVDGVRGDIAFVQSYFETGAFMFPSYGQIRADFNNFSGMFAFNGRQFATLLARALFPGANLARVSQFQVSIVSPDPAEKIVPHGETVPLVVSITGGRTSKAVLETFTQGGQREVVQMIPIGPDQFSATVQVARENVLYRVRAGDAITRKYRLDAVARPHVVAFAKTYTFPEYARLAPKSVSEENGDLAALEGSEVQLSLETNQPVKNGELRVDQGRKQFTVPLVAGDGNKLTAKVPMNTSGTYRVFLVGAQTGFENKFSPEYEIRAEADLVPQVDMELPKQDLIIPANEIVDVRGTASDDLALAKVVQVVKINDGPWKDFILAKDAGATADCTISGERRPLRTCQSPENCGSIAVDVNRCGVFLAACGPE